MILHAVSHDLAKPSEKACPESIPQPFFDPEPRHRTVRIHGYSAFVLFRFSRSSASAATVSCRCHRAASRAVPWQSRGPAARFHFVHHGAHFQRRSRLRSHWRLAERFRRPARLRPIGTDNRENRSLIARAFIGASEGMSNTVGKSEATEDPQPEKIGFIRHS